MLIPQYFNVFWRALADRFKRYFAISTRDIVHYERNKGCLQPSARESKRLLQLKILLSYHGTLGQALFPLHWKGHIYDINQTKEAIHRFEVIILLSSSQLRVKQAPGHLWRVHWALPQREAKKWILHFFGNVSHPFYWVINIQVWGDSCRAERREVKGWMS